MPRPKRTKVGASTITSTTRVADSISKTKGGKANIDTTTNPQDPTSKLRTRRQAAEPIDSEVSSPKMSGALQPLAKKNTRAGRKSDEVQNASEEVDIVATVEDEEARVPESSAMPQQRQTRSRVSGAAVKGADVQRQRSPLAVEPDEEEPSRLATPSDQDDTTREDLYALSPGGEASQARIKSRFLARKSMQAQGQLGNASKGNTRATPAVDKSMLALTNFKRRARQPSLLRMVTEPSVLGLGGENGDDTIDDLDDFELGSDEQSTPLPSKKQHMTSATHRSGSDNEASGVTSSSRKRKRGQDVQVPASSPPLSSPPPGLSYSRSPVGSDDVELPDDVVQSTAQAQPQVYSDTMAPPMSSSVLGDDSHLVDLPSPQTARTALKRGVDQVKRQKNVRNKALDTVTLESLLPKSRRARKPVTARRQDGFDLDSSDVDASSDAPQPKTPLRSRGAKAKQTGKAAAHSKTTPGRLQKTGTSPISTRKAASSIATRQSKRRTTYSRVRPDEDKENESDEDVEDDRGSETETPARRRDRRAKSRPLEEVQQSEELAAVRQKFAAVDEWEMEFESMESGPTSSDWR